MQTNLFLIVSLAGSGLAHFIMQNPKPIGSTDATQAENPCGGFEPTDRKNEIEWPVGGRSVYLVTTHLESIWAIRAALINDTERWYDLGPQIYQSGQGHYCVPNVPGVEEWVGEEAVVQVIQESNNHGVLFQCVAVKFASGGASSVSSDCRNSTNIEARFTSTQLVEPATVGTATGGQSPQNTGDADEVEDGDGHNSGDGEGSGGDDDGSLAGLGMASMSRVALVLALGPMAWYGMNVLM